MSENKLTKHYLHKLATNLFRIPVSFAMQALFPRLLGPVAYGNFDFLYDFSNKMINFIDNGASVAFYSKLSQDKSDLKLVRFFWMLVFLIIIIYVVIIFGIFSLGVTNDIWPGQQSSSILWSVLLAILTLCSIVALQMLDAYDLTISGERLRIAQLVIALLVFFGIFIHVGQISLGVFYLFQLFIILVLIAGSWYVLRTSHYSLIPRERLSKEDYKLYASSFWAYSHPLVSYSLVAMIVGLGERWLLQKFGGSTQQAYFGLSYRIGAFIFLFTSAMMPLLLREFSKLNGKLNSEAITSLFLKNLKLLFAMATFLAVIISFNSKFTALILGGDSFIQAAAILGLMAFYPVHQTLGQMNATLFYSTNRTREYRNIGISIMPIGLAFCFFLIAPKEYLGLDLGAKGLAYSMLITQIITVNVTLYSNCRFLKLSYRNLFFFQLSTICLFVGIGFLVNEIVAGLETNLLFKTGIHIAITSTFIFLMVFIFPGILGFGSRGEIAVILRNIKGSK